MITGTDQHEADEEARQHSDGPEASPTGFHQEDSWDSTDEERSAADQGHVVGLKLVEAHLGHEHTHVVLKAC